MISIVCSFLARRKDSIRPIKIGLLAQSSPSTKPSLKSVLLSGSGIAAIGKIIGAAQFFSVYAKSYFVFLGLIIEHKYFMNFKQFERRICLKAQTKYSYIALYYIKIDATQMLRNFFFALEGKRPNRELLLRVTHFCPFNSKKLREKKVRPIFFLFFPIERGILPLKESRNP